MERIDLMHAGGIPLCRFPRVVPLCVRQSNFYNVSILVPLSLSIKPPKVPNEVMYWCYIFKRSVLQRIIVFRNFRYCSCRKYTRQQLQQEQIFSRGVTGWFWKLLVCAFRSPT